MSLESFKLCLDTHYLLCVNDIKFTIYRHYKRPKHMHHYNHYKNYNWHRDFIWQDRKHLDTVSTPFDYNICIFMRTNCLLNDIFPILCLYNIFHSPLQSNSSCYCTTIICNAFMHDKKAMHVLLKSFKLIRI